MSARRRNHTTKDEPKLKKILNRLISNSLSVIYMKNKLVSKNGSYVQNLWKMIIDASATDIEKICRGFFY